MQRLSPRDVQRIEAAFERVRDALGVPLPPMVWGMFLSNVRRDPERALSGLRALRDELPKLEDLLADRKAT